jgi:O-antigen ligase
MTSLLNHTTLHRLLMIGALLMPILPSPALGILIALFVLRLFLPEERKLLVSESIKNRSLLLPVLFYFLYVIGLLWTSNFKYAGLDLQSKIPLLVLPIAIGSFHNSPDEWQRIRSFFRYGCLMACTILIVNAIAQYIQSKVPSVFFYTDYSKPLMHPTYLSIFLSMSILINLEQMKVSSTPKRMVPVLLELTFLSANMILLSARMAMIAAAVIVLISFFYYLYLRSLNSTQVAGCMGLIIGCVLIYQVANRFSDRFSQVESAINVSDQPSARPHNSASGRVEIWKQSLSLLEAYWMTGTGTGDVKDELMASYARNNFTYGLERKLNSHNQFLQTFLTLGITGLIALLSLFLVPLLALPPSHRFVFLLFALITGLNSMTESILEVQKGVLCFSFFYALTLNNGIKTYLPEQTNQ